VRSMLNLGLIVKLKLLDSQIIFFFKNQ